MGFEVGLYSDAGSYRQVNQDACCFLEASGPAGTAVLAIVCDGVGGFSSGELASSTVISRFCAWFEDCFPTFLQYNALEDGFWAKLRNVWGELLKELNADILAYGKSQGISLGTTFTGMLVYGGRCFVGQVGDSRAYEVTLSSGEPRCRQITKDQTVVALEVEAGVITQEEAAVHPRRHVLLQAVGTQKELEAEFSLGRLKEDTVYLICCDGFYGQLSQPDIEGAFDPRMVLQNDDGNLLSDACSFLANLGIERGEKDNITAVAFGLASADAMGQTLENPADFADTLSYDREYAFPYSEIDAVTSQNHDALVTDGNCEGRQVVLVNSQAEIDEHCAKVANRYVYAHSRKGDAH